jgi:alpha-tubulin suppressor-like RCC1 family protein
VSRLVAASRNACAIHDGTLACWGANTWKAFGPDDALRTEPTKLADDVTDMALGTRGLYVFVGHANKDRHVQGGGTILLDHGVGASQDLSFPHGLPVLDGTRQIVVGARHACGRMVDGTVRCWGENTLGQIGDGTASTRSKPTPALKVADVVSVVAGGYHTCTLRRDGTVACWGNNKNGQAGPGPSWRCEMGGQVFECVRRPRRVLGLEGVVELSAGQFHTCARMKTGAVQCWGSNKAGQLGDGTTDSRATPLPVRGLSSVQHVSAGDLHTCALLEDGTARCWGDNGNSELGRGTEDSCGDEHQPCGLTPGPVNSVDGLEDVVAGWEFTCARRATGSVWCWGNNQRGTLGDGAAAYRENPIRVVW